MSRTPTASRSRRSRGRLGASVAALAVLAACARPASDRAAPPAAGEWRSFEGTVSTAGERRTLDVAPDRQASILELSGSLLLTGERGIGAGFQTRAIAYSDGAGSSFGRSVWTDELGDRIFSELRGAPIATGQRIVGTITGGTGRWSGIAGEYAFEWTYVIDVEGRLQGRADGVRGRARIVAPDGGRR